MWLKMAQGDYQLWRQQTLPALLCPVTAPVLHDIMLGQLGKQSWLAACWELRAYIMNLHEYTIEHVLITAMCQPPCPPPGLSTSLPAATDAATWTSALVRSIVHSMRSSSAPPPPRYPRYRVTCHTAWHDRQTSIPSMPQLVRLPAQVKHGRRAYCDVRD